MGMLEITLDTKTGKITGVKHDGTAVTVYQGTKGASKKGDKIGKDGKCKVKDKKDKGELVTCDGGTDPCCYRDPDTGEEWCWC